MCGVGSGRADNPGIGSPPGSGASQAGSKEDNPHSIAHAHHLTGGVAGQLAGETPPFRGKKKKKGKKSSLGLVVRVLTSANAPALATWNARLVSRSLLETDRREAWRSWAAGRLGRVES